jgi:hypothetical protein
LRPPAGAWDAIAAEVEHDLDEPEPGPAVSARRNPSPYPPECVDLGPTSRGAVARPAAVAVLRSAAAGGGGRGQRRARRPDRAAARARCLNRRQRRRCSVDDGRWVGAWCCCPAGPATCIRWRAETGPAMTSSSGRSRRTVRSRPGDPRVRRWHQFRAADAATAIAGQGLEAEPPPPAPSSAAV